MTNTKNTPGRILIVEDNGLIAAYLEDFLSQLGYEVLGGVASGEEALEQVHQTPPDLVLMDIHLAGKMTGIETAAQIQTSYDIPVVYLTAYPEDSLLQEAKLTNPYGFLIKPIQDQELHAAIEMALYKHKTEKELRESEANLQATLHDLKIYQEELRQHQHRLEELVAERTAELQKEIAERKQAEKEKQKLVLLTERRAEQLAVLRQLDQVITASLCIDDVYHAFARHIPRLLPYDRMSIILLEGDNKARVSYTLGGEGALPPVGALLPLKSSIIGWVGEQGQSLLLNDNAGDNPLPGDAQVTATEIQSSMVIPLLVKGQVIGTWNIGSRQVGMYSPDEMKIAQAMADQLAIAIENARLYEQVQHHTEELEQRVADRTRELSVLYEVTTVASEFSDLQTILGRSLKRVLTAMESKAGTIYLLDETQERLSLVAYQGLPPDFVDQLKAVSPQSGLERGVIEHGKPLIVSDIASDSDMSVPFSVNPQSYIGIPLRAGGQILGVLGIFRAADQPEFNVEELALLTSIADQIGVVVESARLRQQAEQVAVMAERARLARDLHDSVTQLLYSLSLFARTGRRAYQLQNPNEVERCLVKVDDIARQAHKEMRLLLYGLRPPVLERDGLVDALRLRLDAVEGRAKVEADLIANIESTLPGYVEEGLYHIAQEALNNALKHAEAGRVTVKLNTTNEQIELEIADNGVGFDVDALTNLGGLGLISMRERAEKLGGKLSVFSSPQKGTKVNVSIKSFGDAK